MSAEESPQGLRRWIEALVEHRYPLSVLTLVLVLCGGWSLSTTPIEWLPSLRLAALSITAQWPGASPKTLERWVTAPLERALQRIPGTLDLSSRSARGNAQLNLQIARQRSLAHYKAEVSGQLALLQKGLPDGVTTYIAQETPAAFDDERDFMTLRILGSENPVTLRRLAETSIVPRLQSIEGIAEISILGGQTSEVRIVVDEGRARSYGIDLPMLRDTLRSSLQPRALGRVRDHQDRSPLVLGWHRETVEQLRQLPIRAGVSGEDSKVASGGLVVLGDIARVETTTAPQRSISRIDGKPAVALALARTPNSPLLDLSRAVHRQVEAFDVELPDDVRVEVSYDRSDAVRQQLRDLLWRGGGGLLLILGVLVVMLGSPRATGIVVISVLASLAVALILLRIFGLTLNVLTLAGLVLTVGLLIDNAVIVVEQALGVLRGSRPMDETDRVRALASVLHRVALPLIGGTLTTVAALVPLVYLSGELRDLFTPFAVLVGLTLMASLLGAFGLVPLLVWTLGITSPRNSATGGRAPSARWFSLWTSCRRLLEGAYAFAGRRPGLTLVLLFLCLGLPTPLLPERLREPALGWDTPEQERVAARYNATVGSDGVRRLRKSLDLLVGGMVRPFLEDVDFGDRWSLPDGPEIFVRARLPSGSEIEQTDKIIRDFENQALAAADVRRTMTRVFGEETLLRILFHPGQEDLAGPIRLRQGLIARAIHLAGVEISVSGLIPQGYHSGVGTAVGFTVEARGPSYDTLEKLTKDLEAQLRSEPRIVRVDTQADRFGRHTSEDYLALGWTADSVSRTGLSTRDITRTLRPYLLNQTPTLYGDLDGRPRVPIRIVANGGRPHGLLELLETTFELTDSRQIRFSEQAEIALEKQPGRIERSNQNYKRHIRVLYQGAQSKGKEVVDEAVSSIRLPLGYEMQRLTSTFFTDSVTRELLLLILAVLGVIYLTLAAVFESWRLPWIVLATVPLAFIGVALGFLLTGANFAEGAFIGLVLLIGIAVNDSILLVYRYGQLRDHHPRRSTSSLARLAVRQRLHPMWTTTLTSIAGMLPLMIFPGDGDFWLGLAVTLVGGLMSSTLLLPAATVALVTWVDPPLGHPRRTVS